MKRKKYFGQMMACMLSVLFLLSVFYGGKSPVRVNAVAPVEKEISGLGTGTIRNPDIPEQGTRDWVGSYVYFGHYNGTPVKYRVLDPASNDFGVKDEKTGVEGSMLLDSNVILFDMPFDNDGIANSGAEAPNEWEYCDIKRYLNGDDFLGNTDIFSDPENKAIAESIKDEPIKGVDGDGWINGVKECLLFSKLKGEKIFLLDAKEATRPSYGYHNTDKLDIIRRKEGGSQGYWWLRSPWAFTKQDAGFVYNEAALINCMDIATDDIGVSPALNINLSSIIFSSVIPDTDNEYKLTIKDENLIIAGDGDAIRNGNQITVPYTLDGSDKENATRISVLLLKNEYEAGKKVINPDTLVDDDIPEYTYIMLDTENSNSGSGEFILPDEYTKLECGKDYYIYILAEIENTGDTDDLKRQTDYASSPVRIEVKDYVPTPTPEPSSVPNPEVTPSLAPEPTPIIIPEASPTPMSENPADTVKLDVIEKIVTEMNSDTDPEDSYFCKLKLKTTKISKNTISYSWNKVDGAAKYVVYANKCNKKYKCRKIAEVTGTMFTLDNIVGKKLKKGTYYKLLVVAADDDNNVLAVSKVVHVATKGGKVTNYKSISIKKNKKIKKGKLSLKKGKTFKIKVKTKKAEKKKKLKVHRKISFESDNTEVATVSKSGKIKAVGPGECKIYVYTQNGLYKTLSVSVK